MRISEMDERMMATTSQAGCAFAIGAIRRHEKLAVIVR
jgi:hypothetical protein